MCTATPDRYLKSTRQAKVAELSMVKICILLYLLGLSLDADDISQLGQQRNWPSH
jgi:hypothetical protein